MSERQPCIEGGNTHAWRSTGLDIIDSDPLGLRLCSTRECVWCGKRQHKTYGAGGSRPWRETKGTRIKP